jgi:hypothetical protein
MHAKSIASAASTQAAGVIMVIGAAMVLRTDHFALAAWTAFSFAGSIHQTCIGAEVCDGSFAGRPKISQ